jgi:ketosteroid isomerase-like protein
MARNEMRERRKKGRRAMRIDFVAAMVGGLAVLVACAPAEPPRPPLELDLAAIAAFNERYLGAINDGDIATLSSLTTDGHIMLAPNRAPVVGKAANDALNGGAFERFDFDETWTPEETVVAGDFAYQRGTFVTRATPKDPSGNALAVSGAFLRIYQRQPNGEWRMIRDMFNSDGTSGLGSE